MHEMNAKLRIIEENYNKERVTIEKAEIYCVVSK